MLSRAQLLSALVFGLVVAGCARNPAVPDETSPASARFDGGFTMGGGGRTEVTDSTQSDPTAAGIIIETCDASGRGGFTMGGGGVVAQPGC